MSKTNDQQDVLSLTDHSMDDISSEMEEEDLEYCNVDDAFEDVDLGDDETFASSSTDIEAGETEDDNDDSAKEGTFNLERSDSTATMLWNTLLNNDHEFLMTNPRLGRRARDFAFARSERAAKGSKPAVRGFLNLFEELALIRADLKWAIDAAWRRENRMPYIRYADYEKARRKRSWKRPYLTYIIMAFHFALMIYELYLNNWTFAPFKENVSFGPPGTVLLEAGGLNTLTMVQTGSWFRLVSSTFLHAGILHLLSNEVYVYILGSTIEKNHGTTCLALVYFLPSVAANVLSALLNPGAILVGASGGIFGLIGACIADIIINWKLMFLIFKDHPGVSKCCFKLKCACWLFIDIALHLGLGLLPFVDNFAHLGGFIYGFIIGYVVMERLPLAFFGRGGKCTKYRTLLFRFLAAFAMAFAIALSSAKLSESDGSTIPYPIINQHMNCVELPFWTEDKWWYCDGCGQAPLPTSVHERTDSSIIDKKITKVELGCPSGSMVIEDVSDFEYSVLTQFSRKELAGICSKVC